MYSPQFEYRRADSVDGAIRLLQENPGAKLLAGGHSLIPLLKLRLANPPALIDIGRLRELSGITVSNGVVRIGALTTHAELASSEALRDACPVISEAAALIGDPQVRNRGTIGGNVAHADPASDLPTVLTALDARFNVSGPGGQRTVAAADFFQGFMTSDLGESEVLTSVEVPARQSGQGMAYVKFPHPASRYAVVGTAVVVRVQGGTCTAASVAMGGLVPRTTRVPSVEGALTGKSLSADVISQAAARVTDDLGDDVVGDIYASADYRRAMASVYVGRALSAAVERAG